jgi:Tol biopolymer transport system component
MKPIGIAAIIFAVALAAAANEKKANELIQAAQAKETIQGDLKGAIASYGQAVHEAGANRGLAAIALVRMAECYQKMGDMEARKIFEQVVREYGDQKEAVAEARARLGAPAGARDVRTSFRQAWVLPKEVDLLGPVSGDGRYTAYVDWTNHGDLFVHDFWSGTNRRLTDTANDHFPAPKVWQAADGDACFSRDGKQLVYSWARGDHYELRLINMNDDGIPPSRLLYENPEINWIAPRDWSPDGKSIAVTIRRPDRTAQIGLLSVADGALRVLKSIDWQLTNVLLFSPDGKYLGYDQPQSNSSSERDVFVLAVDGSREIHAVAQPSDDLMMGWSPDGKWLLFASDRSGSIDLWGLPSSNGTPQGAPERLRANIPVAQMIQPMGVTHSGALYYGTKLSQPHTKLRIAEFDFTTGKLSNIKEIAADYLESSALGEWSPDARQMVYKALRGPTERPTHEAAVIRSMETGQSRELRPKLAYFGPLAWSPEGRSLLTLGGDLKGRAGIFQVDPENGDARALLLDRPGERSWYPSWAPDGKSFYIKRDYRKPKEESFVRVDVATGAETEVFRRPEPLSQAWPSPDGRYLATEGFDASTNSRTMLLVPTGGEKVRELMRCPSEIPPAELTDMKKGVRLTWMIWAPDSRALIVLKWRDSEPIETWRVPIDGGEPQKIENTMKMTLGVARPRRSPDGLHISYTVQEPAPRRDPEIWALENFLPGASAEK